MKRILVALTIAVLTHCGAESQSSPINVCGVKHDQVCRVSADKKTASCYKTVYAENFAVCKGSYGYYICCETPGSYNTTHPQLPLADAIPAGEVGYENTAPAPDRPKLDMTIPQSQSYFTAYPEPYDDNIPKRGYIKVCYACN